MPSISGPRFSSFEPIALSIGMSLKLNSSSQLSLRFVFPWRMALGLLPLAFTSFHSALEVRTSSGFILRIFLSGFVKSIPFKDVAFQLRVPYPSLSSFLT